MNETDRVYDELLVTLVRSGDARAGERLAARWHPRFLRTARRLLGDEDLAQEAAQETWAGVCRGWPRLSDPAMFPAWAFGILHRKCADALRRTVRDRARKATPPDGPSATPPDAPQRHALRRAFAALPQSRRAAAALYFGEGLTLAEVAVALGIPVGTAKSRIFQARRELKAQLEESDDGTV